ncbi:type 4a pilus biogenesis protein PilO [Candidatus Peregrinibacteria bacterium]|nr:MAG: type 4a pilus biogenesis protein PilO [Candidatus Peregrinibacteria bacterium]
MKTSQSSQLISIFLLFLIIVGAVVFVLPMRDKITALKSQEAVLAEELQTLDTQYEALSTLSKEVSQSETTKLKLLSAVPKGYDQDALILELTDLAAQTGFTLNAISFSAGTSQDYGKILSVSSSVKGSFEQMIEFLQLLEGADRLMRITSLSVQRLSASEVGFNLTLEAYYQ